MYPRPESFIGKEVDGHRIDAVLGRGGMGIVFKAENIELSRTVALKIINPALAQDDSFIRRFRLEARALAQIHHPNIVLVYAFRPFDLGYYISMEYVHGPTLAEYLEANGALSWNETVFLLKQMLSAFHFAHSAGVIHRDIKPRNILLAPNNVVKITDFGLAKVVQEGTTLAHDTTVTVATGGTIHYMPPEQIRGLKNVDHRGDLFSLGMSMYESLTGTLPFDKNASGYTIQKIIVEEPFPDIRKNHPEIPRALAKIIMKTLEKDPDKRYQSAAEMKAAIEEFEKEQHMSGATTLYAQGSQMPGVTLRSSRGKLYSLVAATTVCVALALLVFYRPNRESNAQDGLNGGATPVASFPPAGPSDAVANPDDDATTYLFLSPPLPKPAVCASGPCRTERASGSMAGITGGRRRT
jgi:serine/threonine protein kinase